MTGTPEVSPWLVTEQLSVHYGERSALESVSLAFSPREIVSLVGPNGAGKSTLLRSLAGILPPSHGAVQFQSRQIQRPTPEIVYVPQRSSVDWSYPSSVLDVVLMSLIRKRARFLPYSSSDRQLALSRLAAVGMDHLAGVQISQLSGGQQQRVFLARALLSDGSIYLLDEPFTGIDAPTQKLISDLFEQLCRSGKTVIAATHDLEHASRTSDRIVLINRKVIADGPPREALTSETLDSAYGGHFGMLGRLLDERAA